MTRSSPGHDQPHIRSPQASDLVKAPDTVDPFEGIHDPEPVAVAMEPEPAQIEVPEEPEAAEPERKVRYNSDPDEGRAATWAILKACGIDEELAEDGREEADGF